MFGIFAALLLSLGHITHLIAQLVGITSDPNRVEDEGYIVRLVGQVVTVSVETVKLVEALAQAVRQEDWLSEMVQ